ncbi:hypothetical protein BD414DRAFT_484109 [Trametes punicea]|nr:hypothetical protein BD414DRAFT_484109 [Trametes punicea]
MYGVSTMAWLTLLFEIRPRRCARSGGEGLLGISGKAFDSAWSCEVVEKVGMKGEDAGKSTGVCTDEPVRIVQVLQGLRGRKRVRLRATFRRTDTKEPRNDLWHRCLERWEDVDEDICHTSQPIHNRWLTNLRGPRKSATHT